jgi:hypothetical protein
MIESDKKIHYFLLLIYYLKKYLVVSTIFINKLIINH